VGGRGVTEESEAQQKISKSRRSKTAKENATCLMAMHTHTARKGDVKSKCRKNSFPKRKGWGENPPTIRNNSSNKM